MQCNVKTCKLELTLIMKVGNLGDYVSGTDTLECSLQKSEGNALKDGSKLSRLLLRISFIQYSYFISRMFHHMSSRCYSYFYLK